MTAVDLLPAAVTGEHMVPSLQPSAQLGAGRRHVPRTKVVGTLGPASNTPEGIRSLTRTFTAAALPRLMTRIV